jgi:hypothetical protein
MMFTLFEGWFWCFFLEKKDILRDLEPKKDGMVDGGGDYGGMEDVLSAPLAASRGLTGRHRSLFW